MKGIKETLLTLIVTKNKNKISSLSDCVKIDNLKTKVPYSSKLVSMDNESPLIVETPIPRKFTNILGLKNQYSLEQIEEFLRKCLNKAANNKLY